MSRLWRGLKTVVQTSPANSHHYHTIQAIPREFSGSCISSRDRAQGRIPAVVFSQGLLEKNPSNRSPPRKRLLTTEGKQIRSIIKSVELPIFCSTTFQLHIRAGSGSSVLLESGRVLPIKIHRDETGKILNLVFVWADEGTELKVDVPVVFKGLEDCPGLKKGVHVGYGEAAQCTPYYHSPFHYLNVGFTYMHVTFDLPMLNLIEVFDKHEHIPQKIEVDVSKLDIDDRVLMHDIEVHPSLKLLSKNESMPICKIMDTYSSNPEPVKV
ncbi:hypothetical protein V6N13_044774 [Hibiscus sabdariffa]